jgi:hypothetical protein
MISVNLWKVVTTGVVDTEANLPPVSTIPVVATYDYDADIFANFRIKLEGPKAN